MNIKSPKLLERDILNEICQYLKLNNLFFWRSNNIPVFGMNNGGKMTFRSMPKFSMKGVPDIIMVYEGKFIGIEVKKPKLKLSSDQFIFKAMVEANGGIYECVHSLDETKSLLMKFI